MIPGDPEFQHGKGQRKGETEDMGKAIQESEREQIRKLKARGMKTAEIATRTGRSPSSVRAILRDKEAKAAKEPDPKPANGILKEPGKLPAWTEPMTKTIEPGSKGPKDDLFEESPGSSGTGEKRRRKIPKKTRVMLVLDGGKLQGGFPAALPICMVAARDAEDAANWTAASLPGSNVRTIELPKEMEGKMLVFQAVPETGDMTLEVLRGRSEEEALLRIAEESAALDEEEEF